MLTNFRDSGDFDDICESEKQGNQMSSLPITFPS